MKPLACLLTLLIVAAPAFAHDMWIETGSPRIDAGQAITIDVKLGNHGNHHRDFKLAGAVDPATLTLELIGPTGSTTDLKPRLEQTSTQAGEPYWTLVAEPTAPGRHLVVSLDDKVVHYAPKRSIKSAKTSFVVDGEDDASPAKAAKAPEAPEALGHPLELVMMPAGDGADGGPTRSAIEVQLLFHGKPLADTRVSFIPRGVTLQGHFDPRYERHTDERGKASFTPERSGVHLIVAHHEDPGATGEGYESTAYSATFTVIVP